MSWRRGVGRGLGSRRGRIVLGRRVSFRFLADLDNVIGVKGDNLSARQISTHHWNVAELANGRAVFVYLVDDYPHALASAALNRGIDWKDHFGEFCGALYLSRFPELGATARLAQAEKCETIIHWGVGAAFTLESTTETPGAHTIPQGKK